MKTVSIAIDGPAASGKSTIGALVAARLGYVYIDTGAMYRAVAWAALERQIDIADEAAVTSLAQQLDIDITNGGQGDGRQYTVLADGQDVTWAIREAPVNAHVSTVAAYGGVRAALTPKQRAIAARRGVVMVGRDIGTVVLPKAEVKVYLDASLAERARRRYDEARVRGMMVTMDAVVANLMERDRIDSTRADAPLAVARGAVVIDSTALGIEDVVSQVLALVAAEAACP